MRLMPITLHSIQILSSFLVLLLFAAFASPIDFSVLKKFVEYLRLIRVENSGLYLSCSKSDRTMEQRSSEKSAATSSTQNNQFQNEQNLANNEFNPLLQYSSSQELPTDKELNYRVGETSDFQQSNLELLASLGSSISRAPSQGEFLSQFNEAYENLPPAASQSHDQILYNYPLSNLPPEFYSMPSSSRLQWEHIGSSQDLLFGSSGIDPSTNVGAQTTASMLEASLPLRIGNEGINPYVTNTPSGFDLGSSSTTAKDPSSTLKRKMTWQDEGSPSYRAWNSFGTGYQRYSSNSFDDIGERYTLYDKRYQDIGLPVDPHLRIFNAIYGNGNGETSNQKN